MSDIKELESHLITTMMTLKGPRIDNDIHVSNLIDFCPRAYCISQEVGGYYNKDNAAINPSISMAFLIGDAIHDIMRDIFERAGILIKNEFPMEHMYKGRVKITGRCDDIIKVGEKYHIVDIKSISTNNYNKLGICVDATHKQQVQAYMWLADKMGLTKVNKDTGFIVYVPKEVNKKPFSIRPVPRQDMIISHIERGLDDVIHYMDTKIMPENTCIHTKNYRAKECRWSDRCFTQFVDTVIVGGSDDITEEKPAKRKSKPKSNGENVTGKPKRGNTGGRGRVSPKPVSGMQVSNSIYRFFLDAASRVEQQKKSSTRSTRTRSKKSS